MLFRIVKDHGNAFPPSRIVWIAPASSHQHAAGGGIVILTTGVLVSLRYADLTDQHAEAVSGGSAAFGILSISSQNRGKKAALP